MVKYVFQIEWRILKIFNFILTQICEFIILLVNEFIMVYVCMFHISMHKFLKTHIHFMLINRSQVPSVVGTRHLHPLALAVAV